MTAPVPAVLSRRWIPEGDAGVARTVARMRELIRVSSLDPSVREAAEETVAYLPHDQGAEADAILDWILGRVDYRPDPLHTELLQEPAWLVARIQAGGRPQADCDDLTLLALSMLSSIGFVTEIHVVATQPDLVYDHVLGLVEINGRQEALDLTLGFSGGPPAPEYRAATVAV